MFGLVITLVLLGAESPEPGGTNLLHRAKLTRNQGAPNPDRIADGIAPVDGDVWDSPWTTRFDKGGVLEWDLGEPKHLAFFRLQADNNDLYHLFLSMDGAQWTPAWTARGVDIPGVQTRTSDELSLTGRYLRLTAEGGDGMYSIAELEVFDSLEAMQHSVIKRITPPPPPPPPAVNTAYLVVLAVAGAGAYLLWRQRAENLEAQRAALAPAPTQPPEASGPPTSGAAT